jgi:hypothetical protein
MNVSYECFIILKGNKHIKEKKKLCRKGWRPVGENVDVTLLGRM